MNETNSRLYFLEKIRNTNSIRELDQVAREFFADQLNNSPDIRWDIYSAIEQKESELIFNNVDRAPYDLVRRNHMPEPQKNNVVDIRQAIKKTDDVATEELEELEDEDVILLGIKCGCLIKHGVPCIHKATFNGCLPSDYHECPDCGCDHKYDPRLAKEVHDKLDGHS